MSTGAVLAPVFVEIALTFVLLLWMGRARIAALRGKRLHMRDVALGEPNWPPEITRIQKAYENQFELPLLFYALIALALITGHVTVVLVALSWLFVASRIAHAAIHATTNNVPQRFAAYCLGLADLVLMWVLFAVAVATG